MNQKMINTLSKTIYNFTSLGRISCASKKMKETDD